MSELEAILPGDLRAAVAAGIVSEDQAAQLRGLATTRSAGRPGQEPFELYRGVIEFFIAIGLGLLWFGLLGLTPRWEYDSRASEITAAAVHGALAWGLAEYLTRRRRMTLPSMLLVLYLVAMAARIGAELIPDDPFAPVGAAGLAALGFYARFRLPFALVPAGLALLAGLLIGVGLIDPKSAARFNALGPAVLLDLARGGGFGLVTLGFGLGALALALRFDMSDPLRQGQASAAALWLHLMAAPPIVNTAAYSLQSLGGWPGSLALGLFLVAMAVFALGVDRRAFLVSGLGYVVALGLAGFGGWDWLVAALLGIGAGIVTLGAAWAGLRARLLRALPDFPGKSRLPPYAMETP